MWKKGKRTNAAAGIALMVALLAVAPATSAGGLRAAIAGPSVTETIIVGTSPGYDHYDPGNGNVYVSNLGSANVSVISGTTLHVFATVAVGSSPKGIDYDPFTSTIWVANSGGTSVSVINDSQNAVVGAVTGLTAPTRPEWSSVNTTMWVTENATAGRVAVVNGSSYAVVKTLRAGTATVGITHDPARDAMLVSNYGSSNVTVFDALTYAKLATVAVNAHPEALACFDNDTIGECFVASESTGKLAVINDTLWRVEANLTVGSGPIGVQVDTGTAQVYVTNALSGNVTVLDVGVNTATAVASVGVGTQPHGITAYDPARGLLFCANQGSNNVSVIDDETGGAGGGSSAASAIGNLLIVVVAVGLVMVVLMLAAQHSGRRR